MEDDIEDENNNIFALIKEECELDDAWLEERERRRYNENSGNDRKM